MNKKQKLSLLDQFTDTTAYAREWMQKPFRHKEWLCATDGHHLLTIKAKGEKWEEAIATAPANNAAALDGMLALKQQDGTVSRKDIEAMIDGLPKVKRVVERRMALCPECEGAGVVEGEYDSQYYHRTEEFTGSCPVCEGSGEIEVSLIGLRPSREKQVTVKDTTFRSNRLWSILDVMDALGVDEMDAFPDKKRPSLTLRSEEATLLMMGCVR